VAIVIISVVVVDWIAVESYRQRIGFRLNKIEKNYFISTSVLILRFTIVNLNISFSFKVRH
jgi:hypothetical protein